MSDSETRVRRNGQAPPALLTRAVATGLFSGYIPWASGTFGTIVGLGIYLLPGLSDPLALALLIAAGMAAGVVTSAKVARATGHRLTPSAAKAKAVFQPGPHGDAADPSIIVIDEIVGVWVALWMLPYSVTAIAVAFLAFRLFDIVKPPPARQLERLPAGWGIMLDDVAAGVYANLATRCVLLLLSAASITPF
jgi:phosphatidylglycerophosphatase A